jgi:hypothetical protein
VQQFYEMCISTESSRRLSEGQIIKCFIKH